MNTDDPDSHQACPTLGIKMGWLFKSGELRHLDTLTESHDSARESHLKLIVCVKVENTPQVPQHSSSLGSRAKLPVDSHRRGARNRRNATRPADHQHFRLDDKKHPVDYRHELIHRSYRRVGTEWIELDRGLLN